jgi:hypothetical protein
MTINSPALQGCSFGGTITWMWHRDTPASKEPIGNDFQSISVAEILRSTADAFPAASRFPIGESLTQVTLSPLEAADLLFYLMNAISMASVGIATAEMRATLKRMPEGWTPDMDPAQRQGLRSAIATAISKAKPRKSGRRANTKRSSRN